MIEKLKATVAELEAELSQVDSLDDETRALLQSAADDISRALADKPDAAVAATATQESPLLDAAASFEASHPNLAGIVRRLVDAMAQIGI